jgi:hypothetical protein
VQGGAIEEVRKRLVFCTWKQTYAANVLTSAAPKCYSDRCVCWYIARRFEHFLYESSNVCMNLRTAEVSCILVHTPACSGTIFRFHLSSCLLPDTCCDAGVNEGALNTSCEELCKGVFVRLFEQQRVSSSEGVQRVAQTTICVW